MDGLLNKLMDRWIVELIDGLMNIWMVYRYMNGCIMNMNMDGRRIDEQLARWMDG